MDGQNRRYEGSTTGNVAAKHGEYTGTVFPEYNTITSDTTSVLYDRLPILQGDGSVETCLAEGGIKRTYASFRITSPGTDSILLL